MFKHDRRLTALLVAPAVLALAACGGGEADAAGSEEGETVLTVPSGTVLTLRLSETVSTKSHDVGDGVTATVTEAVAGADGSVLVPAGAVMHGTVEESQRSDGPESQAVLAFQFERLEVGGASYPVTATVEEANPKRTEGDSDAESVAKVAIGTAAGAVVGQVIGGTKESTLGGAAAGTLAGAAVAITSQYGDATLREGSIITVRTQEPIRLN